MKRIAVLALASAFAAAGPAAEPLLQQVDRAIEKVRSRPLRSDQDTPWVVMHALIAFGEQTRVLDVESGEAVDAVEYLTTRARYDGKRIFRDDHGEPALPTRGLSHGLREHFLIQDHVDQFLMAFAEAGVGLDRRILAEGGAEFTVGDLLSASTRNFRPQQELAWTLVVMSTYLEPRERAIAELLTRAIRQDAEREVEGGSHHLYGVAYALRHRNRELSPALREATRNYLRTHIDRLKERQRADGAFSGGGPQRLLAVTGHALEWLSIALPADELKQEWVRRAVEVTSATLEKNPTDAFSNGALYHAAHGLRLYREAIEP